jgi:hypothetical protein
VELKNASVENWIVESRMGRFRLMKKNDVLRVRIDADTLTALRRICEESGCNLSQVLRESIAREISRFERSPDTFHPPTNGDDGAVTRLGKDDRDACARLLSWILIGHRSGRQPNAEQRQRKQREVSQLLEALFCALCAPSAYDQPTEAHRGARPKELEAIGMVRSAVPCMLGDGDISVETGGLGGGRTHSSKPRAAL